MTRAQQTPWIQTLALLLVTAALLLTGSASAQGRIFGVPLPQVQRGPNASVTITVAPGITPAVRFGLPGAGAARPGAAAPVAPVVAAPALDPALDPALEPAPEPDTRSNTPWIPEGGLAAPPTAAAPSLGAGHVYGVFVGISHYPSANDLPFCATDAQRVQRAFLNSGVIRGQDSVVLTDGAATRAAVGNALERFQRLARPNDTVVFFFSGHGGQVPDRDGDEADGTDETIVLADGAVTDDELRELLAPGPARDFIALDSCYSGGFAGDLAHLNNSVGFYASAEDQLSYVASEYRAGGYLSYYLAQNINRMGGRDIPMWELQRDLRTDFEDSGASRRQELTVNVSRSVNTRTVLFDTPTNSAVTVARR